MDGSLPEKQACERFLSGLSERLEEGVVPLSIFNDPTVYRLEMERIFGRCWLFVGHETEVPSPGDYALRCLGVDPFIFVRDDQGTVRVLFDSCRHRGTTLCRSEKGNASFFRCPYHGWTYRNSGEFVGAPMRDKAYRGLDAAKWGLLPAPRVATHEGLVFASLEAEGPSLEDYLGDMRWYLDIDLCLFAGGMEVIGEPHRWVVRADWKTAAANFCGDSYHTPIVHRSMNELHLIERFAIGRVGTGDDIHVADCSGHVMSVRRGDPDAASFFAYPPELHGLFNRGRLSREQQDLARRSIVHSGTVFPNLSLLHAFATDAPDRPPAPFLTLRVWQPKGPGHIEIWSWVLAPRDAPETFKERAYVAALNSFSPSGQAEQDDVAVWNGIARSAAGTFAAKVGAMVNFQMGLPEISDASLLTNWPGPGVVYGTNLEEGGQRTLLRHWLSEMLHPSGDAATS